MHKSEKCVQNEHRICEGVTIEAADDSQITKMCECQCHDNMYKMCECQCHDNMYKLAQRMQASSRQY